MASSTLFNGIKFWLSRRIPMYNVFKDDIMKHGGEVVPLERLADMLIVDHLRKDNYLPNSYSYRFIELSVKRGILEDPSDHIIQTQITSIRPVGDFNQNIRSTRTPFTREDDVYLVDFLSRTNLALQGDKAFYELERQNNRHTWQSWRSRWVKRLQHRITLPSTPILSSSPNETENARIVSSNTNGDKQRIISSTTITSNGRPSNSGVKRDAPNSGTQADPLRSLVQQLVVGSQPKDPITQQSAQSPRQSQKAFSRKDQVSRTDRDQSSARGPSVPRPVNIQSQDLSRGQASRSSQPQTKPSISSTEQDVYAISSTLQKATKATPLPSTGLSQDNLGDGMPRPRISHARGNAEMHENPKIDVTADSTAPRQMSSSAANDQRHIPKIEPTSQSSQRVRSGQPATSPQPPTKSLGVSSAFPGKSSEPAKTKHKTQMNHAEIELNGNDDVFYPQIAVTNDENEMVKPDLTLTRRHQLHPWEKLDLFELDETVAANIWRELLVQAKGSESDITEETVTLTANAGIIRLLKDDDFETAWNMWWHANPEKPDDEWAAHFNSFCAPFYKTHEKEFEVLYRQRLDNIQTRSPRVVQRSVTFTTRSPELGSQESPHEVYSGNRTKLVYQAHQIGSPELGDEVYDKQDIQTLPQPRTFSRASNTMAGSTRTTPPRKRSRSFSEVPESPQSPLDGNSIASKRRLSAKHIEGGASHLSSSRASRQQSPIPSLRLQDQDRDNRAPDKLNDSGVQASVDRQLLLEVEEAKEAENIANRQTHSYSNVVPTAKSLPTFTVQHENTRKARIEESGRRGGEESLFVSDNSRSPSPMRLALPELRRPSTDPVNVGPFYEGSEAEFQGDFEDLVSQMADRPESPLFLQPITPTGVKEHNPMSRTESRSYVAGDTTDLEEEEGENVDEWIEQQLQEGHGEAVIMHVLHASMLDIGLARKALLYHRKFHKLPNTKPGFWTEEDDSMLLQHSRKGKRVLIAKHGREALEKRREYLATRNLAP